MTVVIGAGGDDVHAVLLFQEDFLPRGPHIGGSKPAPSPSHCHGMVPAERTAWQNVLVLLYFQSGPFLIHKLLSTLLGKARKITTNFPCPSRKVNLCLEVNLNINMTRRERCLSVDEYVTFWHLTSVGSEGNVVSMPQCVILSECNAHAVDKSSQRSIYSDVMPVASQVHGDFGTQTEHIPLQLEVVGIVASNVERCVEVKQHGPGLGRKGLGLLVRAGMLVHANQPWQLIFEPHAQGIRILMLQRATGPERHHVLMRR
mmetsp:Transcript_35316/g.88299  ORF Transcript_35316/g.88299 Transcript_35316/m.88299 type:complete len:259 (+) Transcript_35316:261-1037(+)